MAENGNGRVKWRRFAIAYLFSCMLTSVVLAIEVNDDGHELILQAEQAYRSDMENRPVVTDKTVVNYISGIVKRLTPKHKAMPDGVKLSVTVVDSSDPELYSYTDGHIVMSMGIIYAMENEAQLAGILTHEVANITEGYYIGMYQQIKAAERSERYKAAAGALLGGLMDVAVDYAYQRESIRQDDAYFSGEATYSNTMKKMAAAGAARSAYYTIKDVANSIPAKDESGKWVDPRLRFEPIADAQGMEYTALAGYDVKETAKGWNHIYRIKSDLIKRQDAGMGGLMTQLRQTQSMMKVQMNRMSQSLGKSGLVQTRSDVPPTRAEFVNTLVNLKEVKAAQKQHKASKHRKPYINFIESSLLPRTQKMMNNEDYEKAYLAYKALWDKGVQTAPVAYGLAKCKLGDFAFGASESEKELSEKAYQDAIKLDSKFTPSYKGLGDLYADWDRYGDAAKAYSKYIKLSPNAKDRKRIERKIKVMKRKAQR